MKADLNQNIAIARPSARVLFKAKKHLNRACVADDRFKLLVTEDEDLAGLWDWFGTETAMQPPRRAQ